MSGKRGFSLSELLLAIAIAAIAILALATLTVSVWRAAKFAKYTAYASSLARQPLERLRGDRQYYRTLLTGPPSVRTFKDEFEVEEGIKVTFEGEITLRPLPPPRERYVRIVSRVRWVQQKTPREASLETIYPVPAEPLAPL
jgi:prepilin-type N-terminal cleavage/methylation domain-containing protein